jgi:hypothetical protein
VRCPGSSTSSGELDGEGENGEEDVWGGEVGGVSLFSQEGCLFIGQRGGYGRCPGAAEHGGLG